MVVLAGPLMAICFLLSLSSLPQYADAAPPPQAHSAFSSSSSSSYASAPFLMTPAMKPINTNATLTYTSEILTTSSSSSTWDGYKTGSVAFAAAVLVLWYVVSSWTKRHATRGGGSNSAKLPQAGRAKATARGSGGTGFLL